MSDRYYWDEMYYATLKNSEKDFLSDVWMKKYQNIISNIVDKKAIDLGCGFGQDTLWLINHGFDVTSVDFSKKALDELKEMIPNAKVLNLDIESGLPFEHSSVSLINANLSIHYFDMNKTIEIFDSIYEILKSGGLFIGRVNSDKNDYKNDDTIEVESNYFYDPIKKQHKRLFNQEQFDILTKKWNIVLLNEDQTVRKGRIKYTWEFILKK